MTLLGKGHNHDKNNNSNNNNNNQTSHMVLTLYVRAGCDNKKYGACPFCQRIFMVLMLKAASCPLKFKVATVPKSGLPDEFKEHGIRNLPAIIHGNEAIDTVEEIIDYIESEFPEPCLDVDNPVVDRLTRNFFSKFCYYIKAVSKDASGLEMELKRLDDYLRKNDYRFLAGNSLSHLDCEILPKLHHMRVAALKLKRFEFPTHCSGIWRYLNNAYNNEFFQKSCPPDQEIILHWADRPDTPNLSYEEHSILTRNTPRFSFDVPAIAMPVTLK